MESYNKLTPAEAERLAVLLEELGETAQSIGKILRHGYESYNPLIEESVPNRTVLEYEISHILNAISMMSIAGDISMPRIDTFTKLKAEKIQKWLHHQ